MTVISYCTKCGISVKEKALYCQQCGNKLQSKSFVKNDQSNSDPAKQKDSLKSDLKPAESPAINKNHKPLKPYAIVTASLAILLILVIIFFPRSNISLKALHIPETVGPDSAIIITAEVENTGRAAGSYSMVLSIDGVESDSIEVIVPAGATEKINYEMKNTLSPGVHLIGLNEWSREIEVLKPADIKVSKLSLDPTSIETGELSTVSIQVVNTGDLEGTHWVTLLVNDRVYQRKSVTIPGNSTDALVFNISRQISGEYKVSCEDFSATLEVVDPEKAEVPAEKPPVTQKPATDRPATTTSDRPPSGTILTRNMGTGYNELRVNNAHSQDAVVILTGATSTRPLLAVYVRANSYHALDNIESGTYQVFFCYGNNWDSSAKKFTSNVSYGKFTETYTFRGSTQFSIRVGYIPADMRVEPSRFPSL